ncbi:hypothetical protein HDF16_004336 [Granulicella aggregans]|uniref:Zinc ribbon domain-containing protein n=1 Tax=Granulicella aggregans TaxID=474949 RepID=A0A7W7ZGP9_9BACT|nr:hypothetical protein [Granulicella aggregans]
MVFPCPNCNETINTSLSQCTYCGTPVDRSAALLSAAETSRISQACSDASYLKIIAWALLACLGLLFIPFLSLAGAVGFWFLRIAVPVMVVRWWIKFGGIKTGDPDFPGAKRAAVIVSVVAVFALFDTLVAVIAALRPHP